MLFENIETYNGMSVLTPEVSVGSTGPGYTGATGTVLTFGSTGVYNIQFSAQFDKTDGGEDLVNIWPVKNGTAIPWSNTQVTISNATKKIVPSWNYMYNFNKDDNFQLLWQASDPNVSILTANTSGSIPNVPSVILTAQKISM
jgi:hypothetical protein